MLPEQTEIKLLELFKVCSVCGSLKNWENFHVNKEGRFGINKRCKKCISLSATMRRKKDPTILEREKERYRRKNPKKPKKPKKRRVQTEKRIRKKFKDWSESSKEKLRARLRKNYRINTKSKLSKQMSRNIRSALNGNKAGKHWEDIVGYTLEKLKKHLEKQFVDGMTWENYGSDWHIDHKIPTSIFNFTKPEHRDFRRCWALNNLQPLWAVDNLEKGARIEKHFQPSLLL